MPATQTQVTDLIAVMRKYKEHVNACVANGIEPMMPSAWLFDFASAPADAQLTMLVDEVWSEVEGRPYRFDVYQSPKDTRLDIPNLSASASKPKKACRETAKGCRRRR